MEKKSKYAAESETRRRSSGALKICGGGETGLPLLNYSSLNNPLSFPASIFPTKINDSSLLTIVAQLIELLMNCNHQLDNLLNTPLCY